MSYVVQLDEPAHVLGGAANVDRLPPADLGAEQVLLGACLLSPQALTEAAQLVDVDDFYRPGHGELFGACLALRAASRPVDPITVADHLGDRLGRPGGASYLHDLISSVPTASNAGFYAEIIAEKAVRRRLVEAGTRITQLAYADPDGAAADLVERARTALDDVPAGARIGGGRQLRRTRASEVVMRRVVAMRDRDVVRSCPSCRELHLHRADSRADVDGASRRGSCGAAYVVQLLAADVLGGVA